MADVLNELLTLNDLRPDEEENQTYPSYISRYARFDPYPSYIGIRMYAWRHALDLWICTETTCQCMQQPLGSGLPPNRYREK